MERAKLDATAPTGGITEDTERLQATEDRLIHAIHLDDTGGSANVQQEVSFSSAHSFGAGSNDNTKAARLAAGGQGNFVDVSMAPIRWGEGEEIHLHVRNNSGSSESTRCVIYYTEV